jgi:alkylation response protein AidB-like acyl-CoA dehydrogenase
MRPQRSKISPPARRLAILRAWLHHARTRKVNGGGTGKAATVAQASESIVADTAARIFADLADPQAVNRTTDDGWKAPLWTAIETAGLPLAWVPDDLNGSGAGIADGFAVLAAAGRVALAVPLAETLLAGWLLARAGISSPAAAMTVAPARPLARLALLADGTLRGRASGVPFASAARHIAVLAESTQGTVVALVATKDCRLISRGNIAGDPSDAVVFDDVKPLRVASAPAGLTSGGLMLMGSAVRAMQTAGALEAVLTMSVAYANERVAFERPIGKFQAVQQNLARLAGEVAAALAVSGSAADAMAEPDVSDDAVVLEAASAKIRCAEAAQEGSAIAHQVFGAIGFTKEHVLHRFTLRMLAWRDDFGDESYWAAELGRRVAARGADEFWPLVASR